MPHDENMQTKNLVAQKEQGSRACVVKSEVNNNYDKKKRF